MTIFEERYKRLNTAQKEAVDTIEGPVMVIAGPGTGKTTILTLRIANILQKTDTPASGILAITFTDAGVKSMKQKLREVIGGRADEVRIHTFHGFASSVINEFKDHFVHLYGTKQITDIESESIVRTVLADKDFVDLRPFGNPEFYIGPILGAIRDAKREAQSPEMIKVYAGEEMKRIQNDESSISTKGATKGELKADAKKKIEKCEKTILFAKVYELYEEEKKKQKCIDFDDLIFELLLAFGRDELLLRQIQEKFLYILVDEHQDTNDAQNLIIKMLADFFDSPNIFIVGDEKQAIYRFQGASVNNFLKLKNMWKDMKLISLTHNYRSHQSILDASFSMIESNYADNELSDLRIKLESGSGDKKRPVDLIHTPTVGTGEKYLLDEVKNIFLSADRQEIKKQETIAIISKNNRDIEKIIKLFEGAGILVSAERSIDIFSHPIGNLFFSLVEFVYDNSNIEALGHTIAGGLWGIDLMTGVAMQKELRGGRIERVLADLSNLKEINKEILDDSPVIFLMNIAELSGFTKFLTKDPAYVEIYRAILGLAENLVKNGNISDSRILLERLIAYKTSAENKSIKIPIGVSDYPVKVMTAHASKGLEFDYVFIPYATEEGWGSRRRNSYFVMPIDSAISEDDDVRDTRRLFYVAITRAKKHASIIIPDADDTGKELMELRFIAELGESDVSHVNLEKSVANILEPRKKIDQNTKLLDYIKSSLEEKGLSVTALNHFLSCPSTFIYKSILKVPELPNPNSEKGNAMHLAMDRVWHSEIKTKESIQGIIEDTVKEYMDQSMLKKFERDAVTAELLENAPAVAESLQNHFNTKGDVFSEHWVEGESGGLKIHGKLDAIVDTGSEVLVFDYKTRLKMSENQIKGLVKDDKNIGGYFRQLVFYKMLLSDNLKFKGKNIIPALVFLTPDNKGACHIESLPINNEDIDKVKSEIQSLVDSVNNGKILTDVCEDSKCPWCGLKNL